MTPKAIDITEVRAIVAGADPKHTILDIRTPEEYTDGHIEGSYNLPTSDISDALSLSKDEFKSKYGFSLPIPGSDDVLLVYCRSGNRVRQFEKLLIDAGYTSNLLLYYPGWLEYSNNI